MFDIGVPELFVLAIAALFIFGPDRLPEIARQAARGLRQLRDFATNARRDLVKELGPEFENLSMADLNPKTFVRKHVFEDFDLDELNLKKDLDAFDKGEQALTQEEQILAVSARVLGPDEVPPFDPDAT